MDSGHIAIIKNKIHLNAGFGCQRRNEGREAVKLGVSKDAIWTEDADEVW